MMVLFTMQRVDVVRNETVPSQLKQSVQETSSSKRVDTDGFEKILKRRKVGCWLSERQTIN